MELSEILNVLASSPSFMKEETMEELISLEPVELNDDELAAVAGGFSVSATNSIVTNSLNNSANVSLTNSIIGGNATV